VTWTDASAHEHEGLADESEKICRQRREGKLSRTYAVLLDALNHYRGKGQQKVRVEQSTCIPAVKLSSA
jgi:hypothetical protein